MMERGERCGGVKSVELRGWMGGWVDGRLWRK